MTASKNTSAVREHSQPGNKTWLIIVGIIMVCMVTIIMATLTNQERRGFANAKTDATLDTTAKSPKPLPVNTIQVSLQSDVVQTHSYTGTIRARQSSDLAFESAGTITEVLVREGESVTQGQVLARLDTRTLNAQRAAIVAQLDQANAMLDEMNAGPRSERI